MTTYFQLPLDDCLNQENLNYPKARAVLKGQTTEKLQKEYLSRMRDTFSRMFGGNARRAANLVVDELLERGETHVPNLFGPIEITRFRD